MDTIFMNSKNSKSSNSYKLLLNVSDKINFKSSDKSAALSNLSIYYKRSYSNSKFKISALSWNEKFELPDESCSILDIQNYFKCIIKNMKQ